MAISTIGVYLMKKGTSGDTYTKLVDIKSFPDLIAAPESLDTTTMSNLARTFIPGLRDSQALEFTANYTKADYETLAALEGTETSYAVWFGHTISGSTVTPDGSQGKFTFKGYLTPGVSGADVNAVVDMSITIMPTTEVTITS